MAINKLNYDKVSMNCWLFFMNEHQEQLYEVIQAMIEVKVNEILAQKVDEIMREKLDKLSVDIQTTINGKSSANIREEITEMIIKEMTK